MTSKKKTIGQRLFGLVMVLALMLTMLLPGTTASAAGSTIDYAYDEGSLTIYKYQDTEYLVGEDEYKTQQELAELIRNNSASLNPMPDVVFTYLKVGSIAQSSVDAATGEVTIGYSIENETLLSLLQGAGTLETAFTEPAAEPEGSPTLYYTTKSLQEALSKLTQTQMYNFITQNGGTEMEPTDGDGYTKEGGLEVGLYLIVETGYPATVTVTTDPFFVSIPMTDSTTEENGATTYEWIYDVTCYPKNSTGDITIDKSVVEDGNESKDIDGEIGQDKTFIIRSDVPDTIGNLASYVITDTLSEGLTFQSASTSTPVVRGLKSDGSYDTLTAGTEYTFVPSRTEDDTQDVLTFTFTPSELTLDDGINSEYVLIEITYVAYLNENAFVGGSGNVNNVRLDYESTSGADGYAVPGEHPAIYTYAIDLQKQFDGLTEGEFSDVAFELYRDTVADENKVAVAYDNDGGYWYITGELDADNTHYAITLEDDGTLNLRGLEAGTYYLVETSTADGYNLLAEPIEIVITSNEGTSGESAIEYIDEDEDLNVYYYRSEEGTFAQVNPVYKYAMDSEGSIEFVLPDDVADDAWINFGTNTVWVSTDDGSSWSEVLMYTTNGLQWKATVGGSDIIDANGTFGTVNVNNQSGFWLPQTGGSGTFWFLVSGGIVVVAAITVIVAVTRKKGGARAS